MAVDRRTVWFGVVLVGAVIAAIVVWSMEGTPPPRSAPVRNRAAARATGDDSTVAVDVKLDALKTARSEPGALGRNPFRFTPKAPPPPPPPPAGSTPPSSAPAPSATATVGAPAGPPPPPPITLKFIGLVEKADGTKIAVLSDGRRPIHGVEGQELEGQYRILKIGLESIEIAYLDGRGRQTIRLTGK